jgi:hypothetical protein
MFCKGGPGKNHQARLPGGLVGLEGLSFILSRTEPWNTVYTHLGPTSPPRAFPRNVSIVLPFRPTSGPRNTSPYRASIRGRIYARFGSADSGRIFYVQIFVVLLRATTDFLLAGKSTEISAQRDLIWSIDRFCSLKLTCDHDFFFEALASNIKGGVISFQSWVKKTENIEKSLIVSQLNNLCKEYENNSAQIAELENRLKNILDTETLLKVRSMKHLSCLNDERPTPLFLSLARSSNKSTNLSLIRKDDGSCYSSETEKN